MAPKGPLNSNSVWRSTLIVVVLCVIYQCISIQLFHAFNSKGMFPLAFLWSDVELENGNSVGGMKLTSKKPAFPSLSRIKSNYKITYVKYVRWCYIKSDSIATFLLLKSQDNVTEMFSLVRIGTYIQIHLKWTTYKYLTCYLFDLARI